MKAKGSCAAKQLLYGQGCRLDLACQRSARELHEARMRRGKQPTPLSTQPQLYKGCKPRFENQLIPSSSEPHPQEFVPDLQVYGLQRETQLDNDHLLRNLLLENAMLNQTKQYMMCYIQAMHSWMQERNEELLGRILSIKQELVVPHQQRLCKCSHTSTHSYESVVYV